MPRLSMLFAVVTWVLLSTTGTALKLSLEDSAFRSCPTLHSIISAGKLEQITNPVFENKAQAREFAKVCSKIVSEIDSAGITEPEYLRIRTSAALASEFLTGQTVLLSKNRSRSVIRLRNEVKIPPPAGFVYIRIYDSIAKMPPIVANAFKKQERVGGNRPLGVTIQGRYIAAIKPEYPEELQDILDHEFVHAYITLASPKELPAWFQEGAATYFSTGRETSYYSRAGEPKIKVSMLPEDYKRRLNSFQTLHDRMGTQKFLRFVRESVLTGTVNVKKALGIPDKTTEQKRETAHIYLVFFVIGATAIAVWYLIYRRRSWWDRI
jgi:hypothetical protein